MNFREELSKELGLGAIAEETMLEDYVKACEAIAVRYHESEVKKLHIQNVKNWRFFDDPVNNRILGFAVGLIIGVLLYACF